MDDCIFCKIAKGDVPCSKVYEDDLTIAFLDVSPVTKGHCLVIPKGHFEKVTDLDSESGNALMKTIARVSKAVKESLGCDFNVLSNNGKKAGQVVNHVHFHIIPRTGEEEFKMHWPKVSYEEGEDKNIMDKIKGNI